VAFVDMSSSARGVTLGGREGVIKVIADRELGGLLGVHVVGPDAAEVVSLAALAMHAELTVDEVAGSAQWHPSAAELLADACQAIADRGSP
jgi:dihydrolipoamide dehydrogenase